MPTAIARHVAHADIAVCPLPAIQAAHAHNGGKSASINGGIPGGGTSAPGNCNAQSHCFSLIGTPLGLGRTYRWPMGRAHSWKQTRHWGGHIAGADTPLKWTHG